MGLNVEYMKKAKAEIKGESYSKTIANESSEISFIKATYQLFGASMLAGAVGAFVGLGMIQTIVEWFLPLVILEFVLLFGLYAVKKMEGINLVVLFAFTFLTGITSVPLIASALAMPNGANIVGNAFLMTSVAFGSLSYFAIKTENDYRSLGKPLFFALIGIIVVSILNLIFFESSVLSLAISGIVVFIMSILIVVDTQNLIKGGFRHPIDGAINLYLDFLNLFLHLLNLLMAMSGDSD